jgi:tetratricopeptide (TPR) repeat protein
MRRAEAYRLHGDTDAAIADFDRAIKLEPRKTEIFLGRGLAYLEKRDTEAAIRDFDHAIRLNPRHPEAILQRANAYRAAGDLKRAMADYNLQSGSAHETRRLTIIVASPSGKCGSLARPLTISAG